MSKVSAVEIRAGHLIEWDKRVWRVVKSHHVHVGGRGGAFMQVEMKDIEAGTKTNQRFRTEDKVERAFVDPREMTFSYQDGDNYVFMNPENYEQIQVSGDMLGDSAPFLQEGMECQIALFNGLPISIELPQRVTLEIVETEPAIKNQTASSSFKPALLSNGVRTMVPPHIASGTRIVVQTEDASYVERAKD